MLKLKQLNNARDVLKRVDVRVTIPRLAIYDILENVDVGLTAYDIENMLIKMDHHINLATIYTTLKLFQNKGLIQRYKTDFEQAIYFINPKASAVQFKCQHCGSLQSWYDEEIKQRITQLCQQRQLSLQDYRVIIDVAHCEHCERE
ncbi:Fur family transcriptional regulator [Acinetobacter larvae]|uniref:Transcriptional repressor n=1 Tax=Acinetobacter larvae TaxID=1789224 RepID=A0A1B2M113_9GAMM|nr:transcriptional repressor [Acinetobacter larvae]AOA58851.1 hypothetical protein BFG52_11130 [Acinetobacter larvae]